ncbi:hypothetical protein [Streptomyces inhibens]|uniref:hypothetical protein n=1 Tax=Streptomyces inhibens TaxID=2293571 RepID=UPI001EE71CBE|nr:hypothetical protein [Streptomyces inhibens]UKY52245.1 hypothetical protein KI385_27850 [Streptomyces inhibens]
MPDLADYFDRLLARHAPMPGGVGGAFPEAPGSGRTGGATDGATGGATGGARRTLVQPRLPGPFERVEALRGAAGDGDGDEPAPLYPQAPRTSLFDAEQVRYEREIRTTERQTVIRTEALRPDASDLVEPTVRPTAPLLRPAAAVDPGLRPGVAETARPQRWVGAGASGEDGAVRPVAATRAPPGSNAASRSPVPALRPRTDAVPAARNTARATAAGRRGQRGAERVVHVQIGRLEVSAAGTERPAAGGRPPRTERREPSLSLADYLARGGRTS